MTTKYYLVTAITEAEEIITIGHFNDFDNSVTLANILTEEQNRLYIEVRIDEVTNTATSTKTVRVYYYTVSFNM